MNYTDLIVIAVIAGFAIFGIINGFLLSAFRIASFFISVFLAIKLYPILSNLLQKTFVFTNIKASIAESLLKQDAGTGGQVKQVAADSVINNIHMPGFMRDVVRNSIIGKINPAKLFDTSTVVDVISGALARIAVDLISLILLYILIRIGLIFFKFILRGISKLPLFKQIDKLGGLVLGALEGLLAIYIICAVVMLFQASPSFKHIYDSIDQSYLAKFFYQNNFIINWMFPKHMVT